MKTRVLLLGCLLALASQVQSATRTEIWEWTDANGVKHFSDYPAPGARKMVIVGDSAVSSTAPPMPAASATEPEPAVPPATEYERLEILSPENEASFFGSDAVFEVRVQSEPQVTEPDHLLTFLDGKQVGASQRVRAHALEPRTRCSPAGERDRRSEGQREDTQQTARFLCQAGRHERESTGRRARVEAATATACANATATATESTIGPIAAAVAASLRASGWRA